MIYERQKVTDRILKLPQEKRRNGDDSAITVYYSKETVVFYPFKDKFLSKHKVRYGIENYLNERNK